MAQASELRKMGITNFDAVQVHRERVSIELGIMSRPRYGPHIEHSSDLIASKQSNERFDRSIGMTDRADKGPCQCHVSVVAKGRRMKAARRKFQPITMCAARRVSTRAAMRSKLIDAPILASRGLRRERIPTGNPNGSLTASTGPTTTGVPPPMPHSTLSVPFMFGCSVQL